MSDGYGYDEGLQGPAPPHDEEAEMAVLGSAMLAGGESMPSFYRVGLKAEHFYRPRNAAIWEAIVKLDDAGYAVDTLTVAARLATDGKLEDAGGKDYIETLVTRIPAIGNKAQYAEIVVERASLRRYIRIGQELAHAAVNFDVEGIAKAERALLTGMPTGRVTYSTDDLSSLVVDYFESPPEIFETPWPRFNKFIAGGFRRGSLTVLSGYSSHGKSIILDQILERAVKQGFKAHLWINEMTPTDRVLRIVARQAKIDLDALLQGKLAIDDARRMGEVVERLPFGITDCAGWTAEEIARDIRAKKPDMAGVDIFQKIAGGQQTWELDEKSRILNDVPKESQANCHVILTAHVSKPALRDGKPQRPNASNLRGTGSLENDADYVVFVHRDINANGRREPKADFYATKTRNGGQPGGINLELDGPHQRFDQYVAKKGQNAINDDYQEEIGF